MSQTKTQGPKNNSCKYNLVKDRLIQNLEAGKSARQCAKELDISVATVNRYKCCLSSEFGKVFSTLDEVRFIERQRIRAAHLQDAVAESASQQEPEKTAHTAQPAKKTGGKK